MDTFNLTNWRPHPQDSKYLVYHFAEVKQADYFEQLLVGKKIYYKRFHEQENDQDIHYFAVLRREEMEARKLNYLAIGRYREKFIPNAGFRWLVLIVSLGILGLAIAGWIMSELAPLNE
ncbi:MAG: hypothetical protein ACFB10_03965 [Salibacteraceae bacterium]